MDDNKIYNLGGVKFLEKKENIDIDSYLKHIESIMGEIPSMQVLKFSKEYGFSIFRNKVFIKAIQSSDFIKDKIEIGVIFGFGEFKNNIKNIIDRYYKEEQINCKFYPLCEGFPGDIIYYSLDKETFGKVFYWHHDANIGEDITLISGSFEDFINNLFSEKEEDKLDVLSDEELKSINEKRKKVGLPLIDKYRNPLKNV